jgi:flagellar assembly protein FliH
MAKNNVSSSATILSTSDESLGSFEFGSFGADQPVASSSSSSIETVPVGDKNRPQAVNAISSDDFAKLYSELGNIKSTLVNLEQNGVQAKDLDKQIIEAIRDLKQYASFFEQATFQLESKLLKTSISIAKKIINIEVGENSTAIAKETINALLQKVKTASKVSIHLNPKDYVVLKHELQLAEYIDIQEDTNVTAGGVVVASDLGNFDGSIEAKINAMIDSFETVL